MQIVVASFGAFMRDLGVLKCVSAFVRSISFLALVDMEQKTTGMPMGACDHGQCSYPD